MLYSVRTGQPAFEREFGMGVFEYYVQNPEAGSVFNKAMSGLTSQVAGAIANSYDFSGVVRKNDVWQLSSCSLERIFMVKAAQYRR